jgi:hypothetical protein
MKKPPRAIYLFIQIWVAKNENRVSPLTKNMKALFNSRDKLNNM